MSHKILHVIRSVNPAHGGPVEVVRQLALIHKEQGCDCAVATLDAPEASWVKKFSGTIYALGEGKSSSGYGYSRKFVPWLKEHARDYNAVVTHGLWQYHNVGTRLALRGTGVPYFVFPHGMLDPWFKKAYPVKHLKKTAYWLLRERHVLRDAKAVLFTCEEERRLARETFGSYKCNEQIVTLGIADPPDGGRRQALRFFEKFPRYIEQRFLLFLGRLHDKKGCEMLIEAWGKIAPQAEGNLHLVMAGPFASKAYEKQLIELAAEKCPPGSVSFPGMLMGEIKWGAFQSAEAFVLPSHQENFGIAVVEALASGLPVLISNKVNIWREILADGAGLVENDDPAGTEALLEKWIHLDEAGRAAMRKAALDCFKKRFTIENTTRELLALIAPAGEKTDQPDATAINI